MRRLKREKAKMYAKVMGAQKALFEIERQLDSIIQFFRIKGTKQEKLKAQIVQFGSWETEIEQLQRSQHRIKNRLQSIRAFFGIDKMYRDITADVVGLPPAMYATGKSMNCRCDIDIDIDPPLTKEERDYLIKKNRDKIIEDFQLLDSYVGMNQWPHADLTQEMEDDCVLELDSLSKIYPELLDCEIMPRERAEQFMRDWENRHLCGRKKRKKNRD